jgi:hypothetical protein
VAKFGHDLSVVREDVERRYLARIEKEQGKNYEWHLRSFLLAARMVADLLPNHVGRGHDRKRPLSDAFANVLGGSYRVHPTLCPAPPGSKEGARGHLARGFLFRDQNSARDPGSAKPDKEVYISKVNDLAAKYDDLVQRATAWR